MTRIGVSTGALARGDFRAAWNQIQPLQMPAVEFSALREDELGPLVAWVMEMQFPQGTRFSVHAPSRRVKLSEQLLIRQLAVFASMQWQIVVHPEVVETPLHWRVLGRALCVENMDKRKQGRTVAELGPWFENLPEASFCLDLGHARQVDPTMTVARQLLRVYGPRLAQVHVSEVDSASRHRRLSQASVWAISSLANRIPDVPVIIESELELRELDSEMAMAQRSFEPQQEFAVH